MNILSLPNELIDRIASHITMPADIVRFAFACRSFNENINDSKVKWFAKMRSIVKEINSIEYMIVPHDTHLPRSRRIRNGNRTDTTLNINETALMITQIFQLDRISNKQKKQHINWEYPAFPDDTRTRRISSLICPMESPDKYKLLVIMYDRMVI